MKLFITLLTLVLFETSFSQTPDYFANNPTWNVTSCFTPTNDKFEYYLKDQIVVEGKTYHQLYKRGAHFPYESWPTPDFYYDRSTRYALRQEGKSIYKLEAGSTQEELLINYDLNIGDSTSIPQLEICSHEDSMYVVQQIDSFSINGEYRKVFFLKQIGNLIYPIEPVIIEGIGVLGDQGGTGEFIGSACLGLGFGSSLNCYSQNGVPYWHKSGDLNYCEPILLDPTLICDSVFVDFIEFDDILNPSELKIEVKTTFQSNDFFSYAGFVLLDEAGDTLSKETLTGAPNAYGFRANYQEFRFLEIQNQVPIPFTGTINLVEGWFSGNHDLRCEVPFQINDLIDAIDQYEPNPKQLIKITDLMGNHVQFDSNKILFYHFDDGSVEKTIILK